MIDKTHQAADAWATRSLDAAGYKEGENIGQAKNKS